MARNLARLLQHEGPEWEWHFPLSGKIWVAHKVTGKVVPIGRIEPRKIGKGK